MSQFDNKALTWDDKPQRLQWAKTISCGILNSIPHETGHFNAFEYGCGTGSLSFFLQPHLHHITLADNSTGMLNIVKQKIEQHNTTNMTPVYLDLEKTKTSLSTHSFDLVYTMLTLHHTTNYKRIITKFFQIIRSGGYLFIADLFEEDGTFHDKDFKGHHGFNPEELKKILYHTGFREIKYKTSFTIEKETEETGLKKFPVFLLKAGR